MARRADKTQGTPALEWIAALLGALIAIVIFGTIGWQALAGRDDPVPLLAVRVEAVAMSGQDRVATVTVANASGRTAGGVQIEGVVGKGSPDEQVSSATIDYVPGHGEATAALVFSVTSPPGPIVVRVTGYEHP